MKRKTTTLGIKRYGATGLSSPADEIARCVSALLRRRVEEGCERAWSELASAFGVATLFPSHDPSSSRAKAGMRMMIDELTRELTTLTMAAFLLPPTKSRSRQLRLVASRADASRRRPRRRDVDQGVRHSPHLVH